MLPQKDDPKFSHALRARREELNLTQHEVAAAANISMVMPGRYERGETPPSQQTWESLNAALYSEGNGRPSPNPLRGFALDELIAEIKRRGATEVKIGW